MSESNRILVALMVCLGLSVAGCPAGAPPGPECSVPDDRPCPGGKACIDFKCFDVCSSAQTCERNEACLDGVCRAYSAACTDGSECAGGWFCEDSACRRDLTIGNACSAPNECDRGNCVDGVCCESACDGSCQGCSAALTGSTDGHCVDYELGDDPDLECGTIRGCDGDGACLPVDPAGSPCNDGERCESGICVDGVCCGTACDGECEACDVSLTGVTSGICAPVPENEDPDGDCTGNSSTCSGLGSCKGSDSDSCAYDAECLSGYCASNVCTAPPSISVPAPRFPWNGWNTGSLHYGPNLRPEFSWNASTGGVGAVGYQIQIDDSCEASDFRSCSFAQCEVDDTSNSLSYAPTTSLPVSVNTPVGRRYYWRIRACDSLGTCSPWSEIRYLDVGTEAQDFNGDGYADFVVASWKHQPGDGAVFVYYGSASGVIDANGVQISNPTGGSLLWYGYGVAAVGDLNGDRYGDLAIGVPGYNGSGSSRGRVDIHYGGFTGLAGTAIPVDSPLAVDGARFGTSISRAGDVDGDGYGDFVATNDSYDGAAVNQGIAHVIHGGPAGVSTAQTQTLNSPQPVADAGFGHAVGGGSDYDGDGIVDLAISGKVMVAGSGMMLDRVYVWYGRSGGQPMAQGASLSTPASLERGGFGASLAAGVDLNGDGYGDLIVGSIVQPDNGSYVGGIFSHLGGAGGLLDNWSLTSNPDAEEQSLFTWSVGGLRAVGSGQRSGAVVGAPSHDIGGNADAGASYVFSATVSGTLQAEPTLTDPAFQAGFGFGWTVSDVGDLNGDGLTDIVVGSVAERAFIYFGGSASPSEVLTDNTHSGGLSSEYGSLVD